MKTTKDSKKKQTKVKDLKAKKDVKGGATAFSDKSGNTGSGRLPQR
jgi:hypothetical protein